MTRYFEPTWVRHIVIFWVKSQLVLYIIVEREESRNIYGVYLALIKLTLIFTYTLYKYTRTRYLQETDWNIEIGN